jgi:hypothetical protein
MQDNKMKHVSVHLHRQLYTRILRRKKKMVTKKCGKINNLDLSGSVNLTGQNRKRKKSFIIGNTKSEPFQHQKYNTLFYDRRRKSTTKIIQPLP